MTDAQPNPDPKAPPRKTEAEIEADLVAHLETTLENASDDTDLACQRLLHLMRTPRGTLLVLNRLRRQHGALSLAEAMEYGLRIGQVKGKWEKDNDCMGGQEYVEELVDIAMDVLAAACGTERSASR